MSQKIKIIVDGPACFVEVDGVRVKGVQKVIFSALNKFPREFLLDLTIRAKDLEIEGDGPIVVQKTAEPQAAGQMLDGMVVGQNFKETA